MDSAAVALTEGVKAIEAGETEISLAAANGSDSSAIAVLLAWRRRAAALERALGFVDVPPALASIARLYGVEQFLAAGVTTAIPTSRA